jgi:DNA-binding MarR family transcriptional regulator
MRGSKPNLISTESLAFRPLSDELVLALLKRIITARRARRHFFHPSLLAQPSWEMLLEAYLAFLEQREISVSALSDAAAVPSTTGLRWVSKLEDEHMLVRKSDPLDKRRVWIELSPRGISAMTRYFESIANALPVQNHR